MLAQNFKTAKELGLADAEVEALITVLGMLERGDIARAEFHMGHFRHECRTPACICGWAHHISGGQAFPELTVHLGPILLYRRFSKRRRHHPRASRHRAPQLPHARRAALGRGGGGVTRGRTG